MNHTLMPNQANNKEADGIIKSSVTLDDVTKLWQVLQAVMCSIFWLR